MPKICFVSRKTATDFGQIFVIRLEKYKTSGKHGILLQTTGQLLELQQSVYCLDNDHRGNHPKVAIGSKNFMYIVREEKKS